MDPKFQTPREVDDFTCAIGAMGNVLRELLPSYASIPREFLSHNNPYVKVQQEWFFDGLKPGTLIPKPGIDHLKAMRHLRAIQASFDPPHEHKEAGVAYLMSLWFDLASQG